jgi:ATP-dependent Lon protease
MIDLEPFLEAEDLKELDHLPVFPMANAVLMPGEPLSLHITDPQEKEILEASEASSHLLAVAHAKTSRLREGLFLPDLHGVAVLSRLVMKEELPDGSWNVILLGLARIRLAGFPQTPPFQNTRTEILTDRFSDISPGAISSLESEISGLTQLLLKNNPSADAVYEAARPVLENMSQGFLPLGALCDLASAAFVLAPAEKQMLLEETDVVSRAQKLIFSLKFQLNTQSAGAGGNVSNLLH